MNLRHTLAAALVATALPLAADASVVTFSNVVGTWSNASPEGVIAGNGTATPTLRWGDATTPAGPSGYNFVANPMIPPLNVPPTPSPDFRLGTFTHLNNPILPPFLTSVRLTVTADVDVNGTLFADRNFVFNFTHIETLNTAEPCQFGGANGQGINDNGCADRVTVSISTSTSSFTIGSEQFTVTIRGFEVDGVLVNQFLTRERTDNVAELIAFVTERDLVIPTPAALGLFGIGLLGLAALRRRA